MENEDEEDFEYQASFENCTCDHKPEDHDWGSGCNIEGCDCEGGWTE